MYIFILFVLILVYLLIKEKNSNISIDLFNIFFIHIQNVEVKNF